MPAVDAGFVYACACVALAYLVLGLVGVGSALVAVPLLAWRWPLAFVVPLVLMIDVAASLLHTGLNLERVAWREIPRLVPTALVGALVGAFAVQRTRGGWLLLVLGLYVIAVAVRGLRAARASGARAGPPVAPGALAGAPDSPTAPLPPPRPLHAALAGFAIGLVEAMFGTAGPVVIAWLVRRLPDPQVLRATLPMSFVLFSSMAVASTGLAGALGARALWLTYAGLLPVALAAVLAGHALARRLSAARLTPIVHGLLAASGAALLLRGAAMAV